MIPIAPLMPPITPFTIPFTLETNEPTAPSIPPNTPPTNPFKPLHAFCIPCKTFEILFPTLSITP